MTPIPYPELDAELSRLDGRSPDSVEYQRLSTLITVHPDASRLAGLDPFSAEYREAAMALYLSLRGRPEIGYDPTRDEANNNGAIENLWRDLVPWSFRDTSFVAEFLHCWGQILRLMDLPANAPASVLEYGPGSGQILLLLARLGIEARGVDIDAGVVELINRQALELNISAQAECATFGAGFGTERFDRILFFEAFHHAFEFEALLHRLADRLKPGGKLILCGEPVVPASGGAIPFPWGPRLDALSIFCMRRYGWMELGFTHDFLMDAFRRTGWSATFHPFPNTGRANAYVAERGSPISRPTHPTEPTAPLRRLVHHLPLELRTRLHYLRRALLG